MWNAKRINRLKVPENRAMMKIITPKVKALTGKLMKSQGFTLFILHKLF
jgi:hypothetical protein